MSRPALNLARLDQADDIPTEEFQAQIVWAPARIMELARERGLTLSIDRDLIHCEGPKGAMTPNLVAAIREHRDNILHLLELEGRREKEVGDFLGVWLDSHEQEPVTASDMFPIVEDGSHLGAVILSTTESGRLTQLRTLLNRLHGHPIHIPGKRFEGDRVVVVTNTGEESDGEDLYRLAFVGLAVGREVRI